MAVDQSGAMDFQTWYAKAKKNAEAHGQTLDPATAQDRYNNVYLVNIQKNKTALGQAGTGTAEQQQVGAQGARSYADDSPDAGNAHTGDPYIDELRSGKVAGSEDWRRYSNAQLKAWEPYYVGGGKFKNKYGDIVGKPDDSGPNTPQGYNGTGDRVGGGGGQGAFGNGGGGGGGGAGAQGGQGTYGGAPAFQYGEFKPPSYQDAISDPGYQFALKQGLSGLEHSAAAGGALRTSGTMQDLINYGQQAAAQQYQNVYNRAAQAYGMNEQTAKDIFAPRYGSWETTYGGNLQKYLQREGETYGLLNTPPPSYPSY
jgi:hypothetical protein